MSEQEMSKEKKTVLTVAVVAFGAACYLHGQEVGTEKSCQQQKVQQVQSK